MANLSASNTAVALPADFTATSQLYRFSVPRYLELASAGCFNDEPKVELLAGVIVAKMNKNPPHAVAKSVLTASLLRLLPAAWSLRSEDPVQLRGSVPEPDLLVVRGSATDYRLRHPEPADVGLVIEIADSTLAQDRGIKRRIYAEAALPEYWVVNIPDSRVEVYTQPSGVAESPDYVQRRDYSLDDSIPLTLDGQTFGSVSVRAILGETK